MWKIWPSDWVLLIAQTNPSLHHIRHWYYQRLACSKSILLIVFESTFFNKNIELYVPGMLNYYIFPGVPRSIKQRFFLAMNVKAQFIVKRFGRKVSHLYYWFVGQWKMCKNTASESFSSNESPLPHIRLWYHQNIFCVDLSIEFWKKLLIRTLYAEKNLFFLIHFSNTHFCQHFSKPSLL